MSSVYYFIIAAQVCFLISILILTYILVLCLKIDIEKTSIMSVDLHLPICENTLEIKFYLFPYYSSF